MELGSFMTRPIAIHNQPYFDHDKCIQQIQLMLDFLGVNGDDSDSEDELQRPRKKLQVEIKIPDSRKIIQQSPPIDHRAKLKPKVSHQNININREDEPFYQKQQQNIDLQTIQPNPINEVEDIIEDKKKQRKKQKGSSRKEQGGANQKVSERAVGNTSPKRGPTTKDDLGQLQKVDKYRLLKIKNGEIKNKVGNLREQLESEYYIKKANYKLPKHENVKESDYYSIDNPRTHEANQFISNLRSQKREDRKKIEQYLQKKQQIDEMRMSEKRERKAQEAEERKMKLQKIFFQKQLKKQAELEENMKKKQEIKEWSKIFQREKPLYMRKEEEFVEKHILPQIYEKQERLMQIKMEHRPIDMDEIYEHDSKYMQFKREEEMRKQAQVEFQREREQEYKQEVENYYKGKYRYLTLEEQLEQRRKYDEDPKQEQRIKKARQNMYAERIKELQMQKFKQKSTESSEKKQFSKRTRNINGEVTSDLTTNSHASQRSDPLSDGKRNLYYVKQMVKEKGIVKDRPYIKLIEERDVYPNYMTEARQIRRRSLNLSSARVEQEAQSGSNTPNIQSLKARTDNLDNRVQRGSLRKKYGKVGHQEDADLQQTQLKAIRMKMSLLNNIDR